MPAHSCSSPLRGLVSDDKTRRFFGPGRRRWLRAGASSGLARLFVATCKLVINRDWRCGPPGSGCFGRPSEERAQLPAGVEIARVYGPAKRDGYYVRVDRLWPRGVAKATAPFDEWLTDIAQAPSCGNGRGMTRGVSTSSPVATEKSSSPAPGTVAGVPVSLPAPGGRNRSPHPFPEPSLTVPRNH